MVEWSQLYRHTSPLQAEASIVDTLFTQPPSWSFVAEAFCFLQNLSVTRSCSISLHLSFFGMAVIRHLLRTLKMSMWFSPTWRSPRLLWRIFGPRISGKSTGTKVFFPVVTSLYYHLAVLFIPVCLSLFLVSNNENKLVSAAASPRFRPRSDVINF